MINYLKNIGKSFKDLGKVTFEAVLPSASELINTNKDFVKETITSMKNTTKESKGIGSIASDILSKTTGITGADIKNAIANSKRKIKTGELFSSSDLEKGENKMMSELMGGSGFDFGSMDDMFANVEGGDDEFGDLDEGFSEESSSDEQSDSEGNNYEVNKTFKNVNMVDQKKFMFVQDQRGASAIQGAVLGGAQMQATVTAAMAQQQINLISKTNEILTNFLQFHSDSMNRYLEMFEKSVSLDEGSYRGTVLNALSDLTSNIIKTKENLDSFNESVYDKVFGGEGFNVEEMTKAIKDGFSGDFMLSGAKGMAKSFLSSPLEMALKQGMSSLFSKSFEGLNDTIKMLPQLMNDKLGEMQDSSNEMLKWLGEKFHISKGYKTGINAGAYEKGPIQFDGITKKAITHVIPELLGKILAAIQGSGSDHSQVYDYESGMWTTKKAIKKDFDDDLKREKEYGAEFEAELEEKIQNKVLAETAGDLEELKTQMQEKYTAKFDAITKKFDATKSAKAQTMLLGELEKASNGQGYVELKGKIDQQTKDSNSVYKQKYQEDKINRSGVRGILDSKYIDNIERAKAITSKRDAKGSLDDFYKYKEKSDLTKEQVKGDSHVYKIESGIENSKKDKDTAKAIQGYQANAMKVFVVGGWLDRIGKKSEKAVLSGIQATDKFKANMLEGLTGDVKSERKDELKKEYEKLKKSGKWWGMPKKDKEKFYQEGIVTKKGDEEEAEARKKEGLSGKLSNITEGGVIGKLKGKLTDAVTKVSNAILMPFVKTGEQITTMFTDKIYNPVKTFLFGGEKTDKDGKTIMKEGIVNKYITKPWKKFMYGDGTKEKPGALEKMKVVLFGAKGKDKDGKETDKREGGIVDKITKPFKEANEKFMTKLFGEKQKDEKTGETKRAGGIIGELKKKFNDTKEDIKKRLFGDKDEKTGKRQGGLLTNFTKNMKQGFDDTFKNLRAAIGLPEKKKVDPKDTILGKVSTFFSNALTNILGGIHNIFFGKKKEGDDSLGGIFGGISKALGWSNKKMEGGKKEGETSETPSAETPKAEEKVIPTEAQKAETTTTAEPEQPVSKAKGKRGKKKKGETAISEVVPNVPEVPQRSVEEMLSRAEGTTKKISSDDGLKNIIEKQSITDEEIKNLNEEQKNSLIELSDLNKDELEIVQEELGITKNLAPFLKQLADHGLKKGSIYTHDIHMENKLEALLGALTGKGVKAAKGKGKKGLVPEEIASPFDKNKDKVLDYLKSIDKNVAKIAAGKGGGSDWKTKASEKFKSLKDKTKAGLTNAGDFAKKSFDGAKDFLFGKKGIIPLAVGGIGGFLLKSKEYIFGKDGLMSKIGATSKKMFESTKNMLFGTKEKPGGIVGGTKSFASKTFSSIKDSLLGTKDKPGIFSRMGQVLFGGVAGSVGVLGNLKNYFFGGKSGGKDGKVGFLGRLKSTLLGDDKDKKGGMFAKLKSGLSDFGKTLKNTAMALFQTVWGGLKAAGGAAVTGFNFLKNKLFGDKKEGGKGFGLFGKKAQEVTLKDVNLGIDLKFNKDKTTLKGSIYSKKILGGGGIASIPGISFKEAMKGKGAAIGTAFGGIPGILSGLFKRKKTDGAGGGTGAGEGLGLSSLFGIGGGGLFGSLFGGGGGGGAQAKPGRSAGLKSLFKGKGKKGLGALFGLGAGGLAGAALGGDEGEGGGEGGGDSNLSKPAGPKKKGIVGTFLENRKIKRAQEKEAAQSKYQKDSLNIQKDTNKSIKGVTKGFDFLKNIGGMFMSVVLPLAAVAGSLVLMFKDFKSAQREGVTGWKLVTRALFGKGAANSRGPGDFFKTMVSQVVKLALLGAGIGRFLPGRPILATAGIGAQLGLLAGVLGGDGVPVFEQIKNAVKGLFNPAKLLTTIISEPLETLKTSAITSIGMGLAGWKIGSLLSIAGDPGKTYAMQGLKIGLSLGSLMGVLGVKPKPLKPWKKMEVPGVIGQFIKNPWRSLGVMALGTVLGAGAGFALGSFFPGPGNLYGAMLGGTLGGIGAMYGLNVIDKKESGKKPKNGMEKFIYGAWDRIRLSVRLMKEYAIIGLKKGALYLPLMGAMPGAGIGAAIGALQGLFSSDPEAKLKEMDEADAKDGNKGFIEKIIGTGAFTRLKLATVLGPKYAIQGAIKGSAIPLLGTMVGASIGGWMGVIQALFADDPQKDLEMEGVPKDAGLFDSIWAGISNPFKKAAEGWRRVSEVGEAYGEEFFPFLGLGSFGGSLWGGIIGAVGGLLGYEPQDMIDKMYGGAGGEPPSLFGLIGNIGKMLTEPFTNAWTTGKRFFKLGMKMIPIPGLNLIPGIYGFMGGTIAGLFGADVSKMEGTLTKIEDLGILGLLGKAFEPFTRVGKNAWEMAKYVGSDWGDSIPVLGHVAGGLVGGLMGAMGTVLGYDIDQQKDMFKKFKMMSWGDIFSKIVTFIVDGITSTIDTVQKLLGSAIGGAIDLIPDFIMGQSSKNSIKKAIGIEISQEAQEEENVEKAFDAAQADVTDSKKRLAAKKDSDITESDRQEFAAKTVNSTKLDNFEDFDDYRDILLDIVEEASDDASDIGDDKTKLDEMKKYYGEKVLEKKKMFIIERKEDYVDALEDVSSRYRLPDDQIEKMATEMATKDADELMRYAGDYVNKTIKEEYKDKPSFVLTGDGKLQTAGEQVTGIDDEARRNLPTQDKQAIQRRTVPVGGFHQTTTGEANTMEIGKAQSINNALSNFGSDQMYGKEKGTGSYQATGVNYSNWDYKQTEDGTDRTKQVVNTPTGSRDGVVGQGSAKINTATEYRTANNIQQPVPKTTTSTVSSGGGGSGGGGGSVADFVKKQAINNVTTQTPTSGGGGGGGGGSVSSTPKAIGSVAVPPLKFKQNQKTNIELVKRALINRGFNRKQIIAVLGNVGKECGFVAQNESSYGNTSVKRLRYIFDKRLAGHTDEQLESIKKDNVAFYELIYGGKTKVGQGLGNKEYGDGWNYRGRGFIQLTGRVNYTAASKDIYGDNRLVDNPELVNDPQVAADVAAWFVDTRSKRIIKKMNFDPSTADQLTWNKVYTSTIGGSVKDFSSGIFKDILDKVNHYAAQFEADPSLLNAVGSDPMISQVALSNSTAKPAPPNPQLDISRKVSLEAMKDVKSTDAGSNNISKESGSIPAPSIPKTQTATVSGQSLEDKFKDDYKQTQTASGSSGTSGGTATPSSPTQNMMEAAYQATSDEGNLDLSKFDLGGLQWYGKPMAAKVKNLNKMNPIFFSRLTAAAAEYKQLTGKPLRLTDHYRTFNAQLELKTRKPRLAATPGTSNHGYGLAVDAYTEDLDEMEKLGLLEKYNLYRPMWHPNLKPGAKLKESWHLEMFGVDKKKLSDEYNSKKLSGIYPGSKFNSFIDTNAKLSTKSVDIVNPNISDVSKDEPKTQSKEASVDAPNAQPETKSFTDIFKDYYQQSQNKSQEAQQATITPNTAGYDTEKTKDMTNSTAETQHSQQAASKFASESLNQTANLQKEDLDIQKQILKALEQLVNYNKIISEKQTVVNVQSEQAKSSNRVSYNATNVENKSVNNFNNVQANSNNIFIPDSVNKIATGKF